MSTVNYKSETTRANAVFRYFLVSYVATLVTFAMFLAVAAAARVVSLPLVLVMIAAQNTMWLLAGTLMTAVFDSLSTPPAPPREKWKTVQTSNKVSGKTDVTEIVREKTWKL